MVGYTAINIQSDVSQTFLNDEIITIMAEKPFAIEFASVLFAITGIFTIAGGLALPSISNLIGYSWIQSYTMWINVVAIIIGVFEMATAYAIWTKEDYAKTMAIIFSILGLFAFPVGTLLMIIAIIMLMTPEARHYLS